MSDHSDPRFWIALAAGVGCLALFFVWLATGGRRR
jgi:hypothetical protein